MSGRCVENPRNRSHESPFRSFTDYVLQRRMVSPHGLSLELILKLNGAVTPLPIDPVPQLLQSFAIGDKLCLRVERLNFVPGTTATLCGS